jgi:tRNA dimethylallyltransferase
MRLVPFLLGPTGIGKTEISLCIARKLAIEIISADSRQIYRLLDIGTAKPSKKNLEIIPHHFIDHCIPDEDYSAGMFGREARQVIDQIFQKNKIPLVVGGSGFYVKALIDGLSEIEAINSHIRNELRVKLEQQGLAVLFRELEEVDPVLTKKLRKNDKQRILRGLEVYQATGIPLSQYHAVEAHRANFTPLMTGLITDRVFLYDKINRRVDHMIEAGLVAEVEELRKIGYSIDNNALNTVGYKEVFAYLDGVYDHPTMVAEIKKNSRRYAKRQITWFKKDQRINWINIDPDSEPEMIAEIIVKQVQKNQNIPAR